MPELPEVETTRRGIAPALEGKTIKSVSVRNHRLRWPIPDNLSQLISGQTIHAVQRRAKYLLIRLDQGHLIAHLGMSGSLRLVGRTAPIGKHDHFDIDLNTDSEFPILRYRDPRRFGALLWTDQAPELHPLLKALGPEPLDPAFNAEYLLKACKRTARPIKVAIMDAALVVGVGNIYANESLFLAAISPNRPACEIKAEEAATLVDAIRIILMRAIAAGGSTLRDYQSSAGTAGYFQQEYKVYGRATEPCQICGQAIKLGRMGQRSTFWCEKCQH